jgi:predicted transcriptional regulator
MAPENTKKRKIGSFEPNMKILSRIMKTILERDSINRTNLAQEANVNYVRLLDHLSWLQKKHFVELVVEEGKVKVRFTQLGREFALALTPLL